MAYTLEEAIKKFYKPEKDYESQVKKYYKGGVGLDGDEESILFAIEDVREGNIEGAISSLNNCDTEVREVFVRMLEDDPMYDWNGNRK